MEKLLEYFTPETYALNLTINRQAETLQGTATIRGTVKSSKVKFHAVNFQAISTTLDYSQSYDQENGLYEITFPEAQVGQPTDITFHFSTKLNKNMQGCYLSTYRHEGREERIATTQFESHYAREAFPCIDEPAAKAVFNLTLDIPDYTEGEIVLANTELTEQKDHHFTFAPTPRMSTYLLAWTIGRFHSVSGKTKGGISVTSYAPLNHPKSALHFPNEVAIKSLEYYTEKFGEKYPLHKLDQVAIPDFEAGAMENWGLITYRESMFLADKNASQDTKRTVAVTVAHEVSHQWFGNLVTMAWWDDLWLNESFASIMEYFCVDSIYPEFEIWQDFFAGDCLAALRRDAIQGVQSVKQPVHHPSEIATLFDGAIVYAKGARLMLMLMRLMGLDAFFSGLRDYFAKHRYGNTIGDDLWAALQPYADFDIKDFMHTWLSQPGYPELEGEIQHRFLLDGSTDDSKWPIPEIFDDMSGHYLINLPEAEFDAKLARFDTLAPEQRLRLLIDRELLAKTPHVPSASLFELIEKFQSETSATTWDIIATVVADLRLFCPPDSATEKSYKAYLRHLLADQFQKLDYDTGHLDLNALRLRDILLSIALYAEHQPTLERLDSLYHNNYEALDSELLSTILTAHLRLHEPEAYDEYLSAYQSISSPEVKSALLSALAREAKAPAHLERSLSLLKQPEIVRPQDHLYCFAYLLRNPALYTRALEWLYDNWSYVESLTGEKSIEDYLRVAAGIIYTQSEADKFFAFFDQHAENPVLSRAIEMAKAQISARLALISSDSAAVAEKLTGVE